MQGKPQDYMSVGIVQFMAFPQTQGGTGPIVESVRRIADDPFFSAIEVGQMAEASTRREVRDLLKRKGFQVGFGCQPIELANKLDLNSLDDAARRAALVKVQDGIDQAAEVGATRVSILSGPDPGDATRAAAFEALVDSIDQLCTHARSRGIDSFAIETFDRTIDKKSLIGPNALGVELSRRIRAKHPSFGLMIDLSHFPLQFEKTVDAVRVTKDHIIHAHMGNCVLKQGHRLYGDLHPHFGCEGGENDTPELTEYLRALLDVGYIGPGSKNIVAFEVRPHFVHENDTSEGILAHSKATLEKAWAAV
ncbi:MAG: sugar phosphate isomerase/epimerase [Chloroflexi bacterium]|nr:sugar phosphate isomerase/epimerase [Chloroflexota bacterium]